MRLASLLLLVTAGCQASFVSEEGARVAQLPLNAVIVDVASVGGKCDDTRTPEVARSVKTPWCSLGRALEATPRGWPVRMRAGGYPKLVVTSPSARSAELSLGAFPGEKVTLSGASLRDQQL